MISTPGLLRLPAVAGSFYPDSTDRLTGLVDELLTEARGLPSVSLGPGVSEERLRGVLVPHAGLVYSGLVAAAGWRRLAPNPRQTGAGAAGSPTTVVILGTNHGAYWLHGVGVWDGGAWRTPIGDVAVDSDLARAIIELGPPFLADRAAHVAEHSIEVQLPLLRWVDPGARIVPMAVSAGLGADAIAAGRALGALLREWRSGGRRVALAISSDMAHYPSDAACEQATARLLPSIVAVDARGLAIDELAMRSGGIAGLVCGMCGIEPAVLGLAALSAFGAERGVTLATATSADAGGPASRAVGYLAVGFFG